MLDVEISDNLFRKLCDLVLSEYGIVLDEKKRALVTHRITKRIMKLNFTFIDQYLNFLFSAEGVEERLRLGEIFSTNRTYFFREGVHFDFLSSLIKIANKNSSFNIWCAGCSTGEEVYTVSMVMQESKLQAKFNINYNVLGTDISGKALKEAQSGIFHEKQFWTTPVFYQNKYFRKVNSNLATHYEIDRSLIKNVSFDSLNLVKENPSADRKFDIIFCRNVIIYFNDATKVRVVQQLYDQLSPGGYLILGLTESSVGSRLKFKQVESSIFQKS